jgi:acyl dehydratase
MPIDPDFLLSRPPIETRHVITRKDTILYALGVGADELRYIYEDGLQTLPTMPAIMAYPGFFWRDPQYGATWSKVLHGETSVTIHAPLPVEGELTGSTVFGPIVDKGADKGAIVYHTREIRTADGTLIATVRNSSFLRGDGGFGGSADGQPVPHPVPARDPDARLTIATASNQALIYRLSGDFNPLHVDPAVAQAVGFERPILHGLATFGVAGRALLKLLVKDAADRIRRIDLRFSAPVYPGESIETCIWHEGEGRAAFTARVVERDLIVLNNGYVEFA